MGGRSLRLATLYFYGGNVDEKITEYSNEEFKAVLEEWRKRYAVNALAIYPQWDKLSFFENQTVTYLPGRVRLEAI